MEESQNNVESYPSHRLRTALLEMEEQVKGMLTYIEQENVSLDDGVETTYMSRSKLALPFEELKRSYHLLSKYFHSDSTCTPSSSITSSSKETEHHKSYDAQTSESKLIKAYVGRTQFLALDSDDDTISYNYLVNDNASKKIDDIKFRDEIIDASSSEFHWEKTWRTQEFQFGKLLDENMQKVEELIRRNNKKRDIIKELRFKMHRLIDENSELQRCIKGTKRQGNKRRSYISKLKGMIIDKLLCKSTCISIS